MNSGILLALLAIYVIAVVATRLWRNAGALRALERFAPASAGARGLGHADVEIRGMRGDVRWTVWQGILRYSSYWTRFRFETASTEALTILLRAPGGDVPTYRADLGHRVDLEDEALQTRFLAYGPSSAFARRLLTPGVRSTLLAMESLGPQLTVSAGEVVLHIQKTAATLPPEQLTRCLERAHQLALAVTRASSEGSSDEEDSSASDPAHAQIEHAARRKQRWEILVLALVAAVWLVIRLQSGALGGQRNSRGLFGRFSSPPASAPPR
jgi:hypothetical protein